MSFEPCKEKTCLQDFSLGKKDQNQPTQLERITDSLMRLSGWYFCTLCHLFLVRRQKLAIMLFQKQMSRVMRKQTFWFPTWSNTNQAVQLQKMARGLKFQIEKVEGLYYVCSENKGADQLRGFREADLCLSFSHMQNVGFLMMRLK